MIRRDRIFCQDRIFSRTVYFTIWSIFDSKKLKCPRLHLSNQIQLLPQLKTLPQNQILLLIAFQTSTESSNYFMFLLLQELFSFLFPWLQEIFQRDRRTSDRGTKTDWSGTKVARTYKYQLQFIKNSGPGPRQIGKSRTKSNQSVPGHYQPFFRTKTIQQNMLQLRIEKQAILNTLIQLFSLMDRRVSMR